MKWQELSSTIRSTIRTKALNLTSLLPTQPNQQQDKPRVNRHLPHRLRFLPNQTYPHHHQPLSNHLQDVPRLLRLNQVLLLEISKFPQLAGSPLKQTNSDGNKFPRQ
ncbi:unnamed protein product [Urochloa humidicola]